ncbi:hypothetical protein PLESTB_000568100 [Pleodorina starrii]|uniref:Uncharacterized protein n=1 Tax=Pleodorina starrii TaxID=330485 RepID=A0A9W6BI70_9CHLO|nr:hypothetical protein PLESTB_000568100 [Pleodorina starrii]
MAPKRKAPATLDLTGDDDEEDCCLAEPAPKRRRNASKRQRPAAAASQAPDAPSGASGGEAGPSSQAAAAAIAPSQGSKRKTKAKAEKPEKEVRVDDLGRKVSYRPTASQDVRARIQRAMPGSSHRMFLVDTRQLSPPGSPGGPSQEFHVLGATGNVYAVRICRSPACTCPDYAKGHLCKHILFVMLRVLRQSPDNPLIWQRALLTSEVEAVLGPLAAADGSGAAAAAGGGGGAIDQSVLAAERVRQRYAAITGGAAAAAAGAAGGGSGGGVQRPVEGECPICYEDMVPGGGGRGAEAITFCRSCGNNMHKACFDRWASSKRSGGQTVTCIYCRAPWQTAAGAGGVVAPPPAPAPVPPAVRAAATSTCRSTATRTAARPPWRSCTAATPTLSWPTTAT